MPKWIIHGSTAQELLSMGATIAARAVGVTFGPVGRTVLLDQRWAGPGLVSDGFTINRELQLPDPFMDMSVRMLEDAAERVRETCGDGTTSTLILAEAILRLAQPSIAMGVDPMAIARGVRAGEAQAAELLKEAARPAKGEPELAAVATLAAKSAEIGQIVAALASQVGMDGALIGLESKGRLLESELVEGFQFDRGVISPQFLTDRQAMQATMEDPYLLLAGKELSRVEHILPALERILPEARKLVIIAKDIKDEALAGLIMNHQRGNLKLLAIKAPEAGGRQDDRLEDLAVSIGATVLPDRQVGRTLDSITLADLGRAERVVADSFKTTVIGGYGDLERMNRRVELIQEQLADAQTDQYKRRMVARIGAIRGRTGYLHIGGTTEAEIKEKLPRVRNAIAAAQQAQREGVVPGGGAAYVRAASQLHANGMPEDEAVGLRILQNALTFPFRQLVYNAGEEEPVVLAHLAESPDDHAYDVVRRRIGPAAELGILDAAGTAKAVLSRACSVATTLLTVDAVVVDPANMGPAGERPDMSAKFE